MDSAQRIRVSSLGDGFRIMVMAAASNSLCAGLGGTWRGISYAESCLDLQQSYRTDNKVSELANSLWIVLCLLRSEVAYFGTGHSLT